MRTLSLTVPSPALPQRLDLFVTANAHGLSRRRVKALIDANAVRVGGRVERRGGRKLQPGEQVTVDYRPSQLSQPAPLGRDALLARGDGWWAVAKPHGASSHRSSEDGVGVPELASDLVAGATDVGPAHRLDRETSGVLLLATADARAALAQAFEAREVHKRYLAVVCPAPRQDHGALDMTDSEGRPMHCDYEVLRRSPDRERAELAVRPREGRTHQIRIQLADAGWPIVGDLEHGRPVPGGAPRMALHCAELRWADQVVSCAPGPAWEALLAPPVVKKTQHEAASKRPARVAGGPADAARRRQLTVSGATARIIGGGHPWVIADRDTGAMDRLHVGELVDLVDKRQRFVAMALVDPKAPVCARVVSDRQLRVLDATGWRARAERAIERRRALLDDAETDAIRLVHGQADGLPGLWVDLWGPCLVATRLARCTKAFTHTVYEVLAERFPGLPLYEKDHLADLRASDGAGGERLPGRWVRPPAADDEVSSGAWVVREDGARFAVQPTGGLTTGFYPDQRQNRRLLTERVAAGHVGANLFAHTGAFSVSLARAGAQRVFTVDLSPKYLDGYRANLTLNGLSEADHPAIAKDALEWLSGAPPLDIVVLDPPAFAKGRGRARGWNAQRDYAPLVTAAARKLKPGGVMLCCHNLRRAKKGWLRKQIDEGLARAQRKLASCEPAGPAPDFPATRGFPEGRTFRGLLVTVR